MANGVPNADALSATQLARRKRIVAAATDLAAQGGYDAVQMRDVAARAKIALGTLYRYHRARDSAHEVHDAIGSTRAVQRMTPQVLLELPQPVGPGKREQLILRREGIRDILGQVWYANLLLWTSGRIPVSRLYENMETAYRLLISHHEA